MDISKLLPFIKTALETAVSPEEVMFQLRKQEGTKTQDKERETVDNEVIEQDERPSDENANQEGQMIENSFKELKVEEATTAAREAKLLQGTVSSSDLANKIGVEKPFTLFEKLAMLAAPTETYWKLMQQQIK